MAMILIYYILTTLIFFLVLPFLPLVYLLSEKRRANLLPRLGVCTGFKRKQAGAFRIWVHGLSVGEVRSALPFVQSLKKRKPEADIIFTASTKTGFDTARQLFDGDKDPQVSQIGYFPFDIWTSVSRICHLIEPDVVCLIETDIWPGFLHRMKQQKIPVVLVNARLSKRSLNGYLRMGRFSSLFFPVLSHIMAQTRLDAGRFKRVGVLETRLSTMGNIKFDQAALSLDTSEISRLKTRFGIQAQDKIWIAGSTHGGEEKILLEAFAAAKKNIPNLKLILVPRDPKRSEQIMGQISSPLYPVLFSQLTQDSQDHDSQDQASQDQASQDHDSQDHDSQDHDLIVVDRMGQLAMTYALCDLAFIGGSLLPFGGHNPLEPAMFGKPILLGPHMTDFIEIADLLMAEQGARRVENASQIQAELEGILQDPVLAKQMGDASFRVFSGNTGAVDRTLKKMEDLHFV